MDLVIYLCSIVNITAVCYGNIQRSILDDCLVACSSSKCKKSLFYGEENYMKLHPYLKKIVPLLMLGIVLTACTTTGQAKQHPELSKPGLIEHP